MTVNVNSMDLAQYKGEIKRCPMCKPMDKLSGSACKLCFSQGFIAVCTNCDGKGIIRGKSVWDGGRSNHDYVCDKCSGTGAFPAKEPANWKDPDPAKATPTAPELASASSPADPFAMVSEFTSAEPGIVQMPPNAPDDTQVVERLATDVS